MPKAHLLSLMTPFVELIRLPNEVLFLLEAGLAVLDGHEEVESRQK